LHKALAQLARLDLETAKLTSVSNTSKTNTSTLRRKHKMAVRLTAEQRPLFFFSNV